MGGLNICTWLILEQIWILWSLSLGNPISVCRLSSSPISATMLLTTGNSTSWKSGKRAGKQIPSHLPSGRDPVVPVSLQLHGGQSSLAMRWTKGGAGMPFHRGMQRQPKGAPASSSKTQVFRCEAHPCKDLRAQYSGWSPPLLDSCHWSAVGSLTRPHRAIHCFFWRSEATHHFWRHVSFAANHSLSPWNSRLQAQGAVLGCYELGSWPSLPAKKCGTLEHEVKRTPKTQSKVRRLGSQSVLNLQMPKYLEVKSRFETDRAWPILSCWM